jgi:hypothetical protein
MESERVKWWKSIPKTHVLYTIPPARVAGIHPVTLEIAGHRFECEAAFSEQEIERVFAWKADAFPTSQICF